MNKFMTDYLKKVQKLQQAIFGERTAYLMVFKHVHDDGSFDIGISFDIKNNEDNFENHCFYDWQSESTAKATYEQICARLRELGHKV